jgi:hypothetical protein
MGNELTGRGEASQILNAIEMLEGLPEVDQNDRTRAALEDLYSKRDAANQEMGVYPAMGRGLQQGVSFGFADEIGGMVGGEEKRDAMRLDDFIAQGQYPSAYNAGQMGGMAATSVLPMGWVGKSATLPGAMARGAVAGGLEGGLQGFGEGEGGFASRMGNAAPGALIGATIGAGVPVIARGGGIAARMASGGGDTLQDFSNIAARKATGAMRRAQNVGGPDDIRQFLSRVGGEGTLADVPGPFQAQAMGMAAMPGEGGETIARVLRDRAEGAGQRIAGDVDEVLGGPGAAYANRAAQEDLRQNVGSPLYQAALQHPDPINTSGLADSLQSRIEAAGPDTGAALGRYRSALGGDMSAEQLHNLRSDLSDAAYSAGQSGSRKQAAALNDALSEIDGVLDNVPGYSDARAIWADTYEVEEAIDSGRRALAGGPTTAQSPQAMQDMLNGMKENEREAFTQGVREYVYARMGTARNAPATARGDLLKEWNRDKLEMLLGQDEAAQLFNRLEAEQVFSQTRGRVDAGSMTQMRAEATADLGDIRAPDTLQRPGPLRRLKMGADEAGNAILDALTSGRTAKGNVDLGRILSAQGTERDAIMAQLLRNAAQGPQGKAQSMTEAALRPLLMGGGISFTGGNQ